MNAPSRRQLADYAVAQLLSKKPIIQVARQLAAVLVVNKSHKEADLLAADIAGELERSGLLAYTKVTTATPLSDHLRRLITSQLKQKTKVSQVLLDEQLDEAILGGVHLETATRSWDKTVKRKLKNLQEAF